MYYTYKLYILQRFQDILRFIIYLMALLPCNETEIVVEWHRALAISVDS